MKNIFRYFAVLEMNTKKYLSKITLLNSILIILCLSTTLFAAPTDYDGDGKTDPTVGRLVDGTKLYYYILQSRDGFKAVQWGGASTDALVSTPAVISPVGF
jgi:hypothetical protein